MQNIKGQILYFGSPLSFNDPYNCALTPNIKSPIDEETEAVRAAYLSQERITHQAWHEFKAKSTQELREILLRVAHGAIKQATDGFLRDRGVTCFSEKNDDLLLWSHYGGRYRGICLEFDTKIEPFSKVKPARYSSVLPQLDVATILLNKDFDHVTGLFCTKSRPWSYEKEWRALHSVARTQCIYPVEALKGVYFGPDVDNESLEIVCLVLAG